MKKSIKHLSILILSMAILILIITPVFFRSRQEPAEDCQEKELEGANQVVVDPETFSVKLVREGREYDVSGAQEKLQAEAINRSGSDMSWNYPQRKLSVDVKQEKDYLSVTLTSSSEEENSVTFPLVSGEQYYIPLGEGKRIPVDDGIWSDYLTGMDFYMAEQLSMPFFSSVKGDKAIVYIVDNPNRSRLHFKHDSRLEFEVINGYSPLQENKSLTYRIYLTDNNPVDIAKTYKRYVEESGRLKTLEQKAQENPNVKKLYGAPHIYLWNARVIAPEDIKWNRFLTYAGSNMMSWLLEKAEALEMYQEYKAVLEALAGQEYADQYQKRVICEVLTELLKQKDFYDGTVLTNRNKRIEELLDKGLDSMSPGEVIELNKNLLYEAMPDAFKPVSEWADNATTDIVEAMKEAGIENAWIGLDNWETAYAKPELVAKAADNGYLAATYDSYHSIHKAGEEQWNTAAFSDAGLYDSASISDINGKKIEGFNKVGRKLNPVLSMGEVKKRVNTLLGNGLGFNSWFVDCDATGEIYDDYSPEHPTSKEADLKARLERMSFIRNDKSMVVGSEGGNDFASNVIDFAHGIELPTFSWMDPDMKDKDSEYYIGRYYSQYGGVPEHFGKQIEVKENLKHIFLDVRFDVPLYKLVYNNSVITTYHWDWSTMKIKDAAGNRMLREILFNVPPLYHLDKAAWEEWGAVIAEHTRRWADFSRQVITAEMTDFSYLDEEGYVQKTEFGMSGYAIANYSDTAYTGAEIPVPPGSVLINTNGSGTVYTPAAK